MLTVPGILAFPLFLSVEYLFLCFSMIKPDVCGITANCICKTFLAVSEGSQLLMTSIWFKVLPKCFLTLHLYRQDTCSMIELFGQLKLGLRKQWRMVLKKTNREHGGTLILEDMVEIPKFCVLSGRMRCNISCHSTAPWEGLHVFFLPWSHLIHEDDAMIGRLSSEYYLCIRCCFELDEDGWIFVDGWDISLGVKGIPAFMLSCVRDFRGPLLFCCRK